MDVGVIVAIIFAGLGFLLRPLIVSNIHMAFYRKQLSDANKLDFLTIIMLLPLLVAIMILGFSTASTMIEIPFTSMIQLFLCLIAY